MATAGTPWRAAIATSGRRARASMLVASNTVSRPRRRRSLVRPCARAKAATLARWSAASPAIRARQAAVLTICCGRKLRRQNVLLPDPAGPTITTRDGDGTLRIVVRGMTSPRKKPAPCPLGGPGGRSGSIQQEVLDRARDLLDTRQARRLEVRRERNEAILGPDPPARRVEEFEPPIPDPGPVLTPHAANHRPSGPH